MSQMGKVGNQLRESKKCVLGQVESPFRNSKLVHNAVIERYPRRKSSEGENAITAVLQWRQGCMDSKRGQNKRPEFKCYSEENQRAVE